MHMTVFGSEVGTEILFIKRNSTWFASVLRPTKLHKLKFNENDAMKSNILRCSAIRKKLANS